MRCHFFLIFLLICLQCCQKQTQDLHPQEIVISSNLSYSRKGGQLTVKSGGHESAIPEKNLPARRIVLLNSSLTGYLLALGASDHIRALVASQFVYDPGLKEKIKSGRITDLGPEQQLSVEKIIAVQPDVVMTNYNPTQENFYNSLRGQGIPILFLEEYKEQKPLAKAAYLNLLGIIVGKEREAKVVFTEIKSNYERLQSLGQKNYSDAPILANEMYGNIWYLPAGESMLANYLHDAGGNYLLKDVPGMGTKNWTFEQVLSKSRNAQIWVNVGNHNSRNSLLQSNPSYRVLPVATQGQIYSLIKSQKGEANNFFEEGNVRVDKVLQDYVKIIHPELLPQDSLYFFEELK